MTTPNRTIRRLLSRLSAGAALGPDERRELVRAVEAILDDWARRGLVARTIVPGRAPGYAITALGAETSRWD